MTHVRVVFVCLLLMPIVTGCEVSDGPTSTGGGAGYDRIVDLRAEAGDTNLIVHWERPSSGWRDEYFRVYYSTNKNAVESRSSESLSAYGMNLRNGRRAICVPELPNGQVTYVAVTSRIDGTYPEGPYSRVVSATPSEEAASLPDLKMVSVSGHPDGGLEIHWPNPETLVGTHCGGSHEISVQRRAVNPGSAWSTIGSAVVPPFVDESLQAERSYEYRLRIQYSDGASGDWSPVLSGTGPPLAPANPRFEVLPDSTFRVSWDDRSNIETDYYVEGWNWDCIFILLPPPLGPIYECAWSHDNSSSSNYFLGASASELTSRFQNMRYWIAARNEFGMSGVWLDNRAHPDYPD